MNVCSYIKFILIVNGEVFIAHGSMLSVCYVTFCVTSWLLKLLLLFSAHVQSICNILFCNERACYIKYKKQMKRKKKCTCTKSQNHNRKMYFLRHPGSKAPTHPVKYLTHLTKVSEARNVFQKHFHDKNIIS